ncbi:hypothetical protein JMJ77_0015300 [Colletotrichum scovillei]|uniref:Uncharacterized protein n=1 Tax=Colletotrichum scovillei TaxID=1209932 RepID=A0A9P7R2L1_9PEZI|nr:hypothetical protein JMJ77_0015300 [Colletotrichum scovillei]KAG7066853.1 hypothetical protein JMJ76_0000703 [Colletotrichum scovillei]
MVFDQDFSFGGVFLDRHIEKLIDANEILAQSFVSHRIEAWKSEQETGILLTKDEADDSPPMGNRVKNVEGARLWVLKDGLRRTPIAEVRYDMVQRAECFSVSAKDSCAKPSEASPRIGDSIGYVAGDEKDLKIDAF